MKVVTVDNLPSMPIFHSASPQTRREKDEMNRISLRKFIKSIRARSLVTYVGL